MQQWQALGTVDYVCSVHLCRLTTARGSVRLTTELVACPRPDAYNLTFEVRGEGAL